MERKPSNDLSKRQRRMLTSVNQEEAQKTSNSAHVSISDLNVEAQSTSNNRKSVTKSNKTSVSDTNSPTLDPKLQDDIEKWAVENDIPHEALSELLKITKKCCRCLPKKN